MAPGTVTAVLRVGIIGAGRIGRMHAGLLAQQVTGAAVAAVFDVDGPAAQRTSDALRVPVAANLEALLAAPDVDAVAICTSTDTHAELTVAAARAGKAILCEKPLSLELGAVDAALAELAATGVPFQMGFNRRFDPAHQAVRDAVATGEIGAPHLVRISSRDPAPPSSEYARASGGLFCDMTIHDFDMARYITGSEVVEVYARGAVRLQSDLAAIGDVDTALVTLVHENGCLTAIDNSRQAVYGYDQRVEAFGAAGMAASENPVRHTSVVRTASGTSAPVLPWFYAERYATSYVREWEAFVAAVVGRRPPPVTGLDARSALLVALAAGRSVREGRSVRIDEIAAA